MVALVPDKHSYVYRCDTCGKFLGEWMRKDMDITCPICTPMLKETISLDAANETNVHVIWEIRHSDLPLPTQEKLIRLVKEADEIGVSVSGTEERRQNEY